MKETKYKDRYGNQIYVGDFIKIRKEVNNLDCKDCTIYECINTNGSHVFKAMYDYINGDDKLPKRNSYLENEFVVRDFAEVVGADRPLIQPKKIIMEWEYMSVNMGEDAQLTEMPKCPYCGKSPTYYENPCPYCGKIIDYNTIGETDEKDYK